MIRPGSVSPITTSWATPVNTKTLPSAVAETPSPERTGSGEATQLEAEAMAREIACLGRERGVAWRDVAILMRNTGDLVSRALAVRFNNLPTGVSLDNASGLDGGGSPYLNLAPAVLGCSDPDHLLRFMRNRASRDCGAAGRTA